MDLTYLRLLIDYHYWARDRLLDAVAALSPEQFNKDLGSSFRSVRETLVHVYSAEWAWYQRWQGMSPTAHLGIDQFPDVAALQTAWSEQERQVRAFVETLDAQGVARVYQYKFMSGIAASSALWQMITHMVNHASYHRGQVTTMLRQLGAAPAKAMDLIEFYRLREKHGDVKRQ